MLRTLAGHTGGVNAVAVTPDGRRAVSASGDQTLKVWDLESGTVKADFVGDDRLLACVIAPDGMTIVASGSLGHMYFLRLVG